MLAYKGSETTHRSIVIRWFAWGVALGLTGGALAGFSQNDGVLPINKNLWSPSFVAALSGTGEYE